MNRQPLSGLMELLKILERVPDQVWTDPQQPHQLTSAEASSRPRSPSAGELPILGRGLFSVATIPAADVLVLPSILRGWVSHVVFRDGTAPSWSSTSTRWPRAPANTTPTRGNVHEHARRKKPNRNGFHPVGSRRCSAASSRLGHELTPAQPTRRNSGVKSLIMSRSLSTKSVIAFLVMDAAFGPVASYAYFKLLGVEASAATVGIMSGVFLAKMLLSSALLFRLPDPRRSCSARLPARNRRESAPPITPCRPPVLLRDALPLLCSPRTGS